jgi:hypothetical protein
MGEMILKSGLYKLSEVARILRTSPHEVRGMIERGELSAVRVNIPEPGQVRRQGRSGYKVPRAALEHYLTENSTFALPDAPTFTPTVVLAV